MSYKHLIHKYGYETPYQVQTWQLFYDHWIPKHVEICSKGDKEEIQKNLRKAIKSMKWDQLKDAQNIKTKRFIVDKDTPKTISANIYFDAQENKNGEIEWIKANCRHWAEGLVLLYELFNLNLKKIENPNDSNDYRLFWRGGFPKTKDKKIDEDHELFLTLIMRSYAIRPHMATHTSEIRRYTKNVIQVGKEYNPFDGLVVGLCCLLHQFPFQNRMKKEKYVPNPVRLSTGRRDIISYVYNNDIVRRLFENFDSFAKEYEKLKYDRTNKEKYEEKTHEISRLYLTSTLDLEDWLNTGKVFKDIGILRKFVEIDHEDDEYPDYRLLNHQKTQCWNYYMRGLKAFYFAADPEDAKWDCAEIELVPPPGKELDKVDFQSGDEFTADFLDIGSIPDIYLVLAPNFIYDYIDCNLPQNERFKKMEPFSLIFDNYRYQIRDVLERPVFVTSAPPYTVQFKSKYPGDSVWDGIDTQNMHWKLDFSWDRPLTKRNIILTNGILKQNPIERLPNDPRLSFSQMIVVNHPYLWFADEGDLEFPTVHFNLDQCASIDPRIDPDDSEKKLVDTGNYPFVVRPQKGTENTISRSHIFCFTGSFIPEESTVPDKQYALERLFELANGLMAFFKIILETENFPDQITIDGSMSLPDLLIWVYVLQWARNNFKDKESGNLPECVFNIASTKNKVIFVKEMYERYKDGVFHKMIKGGEKYMLNTIIAHLGDIINSSQEFDSTPSKQEQKEIEIYKTKYVDTSRKEAPPKHTTKKKEPKKTSKEQKIESKLAKQPKMTSQENIPTEKIEETLERLPNSLQREREPQKRIESKIEQEMNEVVEEEEDEEEKELEKMIENKRREIEREFERNAENMRQKLRQKRKTHPSTTSKPEDTSFHLEEEKFKFIEKLLREMNTTPEEDVMIINTSSESEDTDVDSIEKIVQSTNDERASKKSNLTQTKGKRKIYSDPYQIRSPDVSENSDYDD